MVYRANPSADRIVDIDAGTTYQAFLGVGAALTEAACYNLMTKLALAQRTSIPSEWLVTNGQSLFGSRSARTTTAPTCRRSGPAPTPSTLMTTAGRPTARASTSPGR